LVAHDPYFSIWSCADRLTDDTTRHWTGTPHSLTGLVRVDGHVYRIMGAEPSDAASLAQVDLRITPTQTVYEFEGAGVRVLLRFTSPLLPHDPDVLARPVTYITWSVATTDGRAHAVQVYLDAAGSICVNSPEQAITWAVEPLGELVVARAGSVEQPVLEKKGDNLRIDWGHLYLAVPEASWSSVSAGEQARNLRVFAEQGRLPHTPDTRMPRAASDETPVLAAACDLGRIGPQAVERHLMLAYDDEFSILYFREKLRPYWRRDGMDAAGLLRRAEREYDDLRARCDEFDAELTEDLVAVGGRAYADICVLAFRQAVAGHKVAADSAGRPLVFGKECFSNGCIGTVDVIYPAAPFFLLLSPTLTKALLVPVLDYASSERWTFPFAPHDLGTYPHATGQVYGGGERTEENQMPVEECGNMILLLAALSKAEGNADFVSRYGSVVARWAEYLKSKGLDPENQLCTDDFAGHLARNANLSAKAILALAAYGYLSELRGDVEQARDYQRLAKRYARRWTEMALDGDHYRLAFDRPGTWSQKYNLVWDRILGLGCFPPEVARTEVAYYQSILNPYGLPLDSRQTYTKTDWHIWTACLADTPEDFEAFVAPVARFLNATPERVPMTDWYQTTDATMVGFRARPVVGGVFIKMLTDGGRWSKWRGRGHTDDSAWAPFPRTPRFEPLVPCAQQGGVVWRYTTDRPGGDWFAPGYDDSEWLRGESGFGQEGTPGSVVRTAWRTPDIWMRRTFELEAGEGEPVALWIHHDEAAEVYLNGVLAAKTSGYLTEYDVVDIAGAAQQRLCPGVNTLAVHCHQTVGGQYIDVGLVRVVEP